MRAQLRAIRMAVFEIMEYELKEWEDHQVAQICGDAHEREKSLDGMRDFKNTMWAEIVDGPTERAWEAFHKQRRSKQDELAQKGHACVDYWRAEFNKWGTAPFRV